MMREKRTPYANGIWSVGRRNWNEDFEMPADDRNCTGHFGADAFCLALHGTDLHIRFSAWPAQYCNCSAWRGCNLAAGQGAEFEICDPEQGVWVNDANIIWSEQEAGQWDMRPNALLLCLFGTNCNIFLIATFRFIGNSHF